MREKRSRDIAAVEASSRGGLSIVEAMPSSTFGCHPEVQQVRRKTQRILARGTSWMLEIDMKYMRRINKFRLLRGWMALFCV